MRDISQETRTHEPTVPIRGKAKPVAAVIETIHRVTLSLGQARAIELLRQTRPVKAAPLVLITDPNKDPDDLCALVAMKYLQDQGFVDLRCVLTTLGDNEIRTTRARFARSVLDDLGLTSARVGVGVDYGFEVTDANGVVDTKATQDRVKDHCVFLETPLLRALAVVEIDGLLMIKDELDRIPDHSAVFVVNAGMADMVELLREAPDLMKQKTAKVVIMGGVEPGVDKRGFVVADKRAYNNIMHQPSADYFYSRVQELSLPLVVLNKEATYTAAAPRSFYDGIAATKHPIGVYLNTQQMQSLKNLWDGIHQGRHPKLTQSWFFETFTDVDIHSPAGELAMAHANTHAEDFEGVWNQVSKLNLYDPLALLAATPGAAELLFHSEIPNGAVSNVRVIGKTDIRDSTLIKDLIAGLGIESLNPPGSRSSSF